MTAASQAGDLIGQAAVLHRLGKFRADQQMAAEAFDDFQRSQELFESVGHRHGTGVAAVYVAMAHRFLGRNDEALAHYNLALDLLTETGNVGGQAHVLRSIGQIHLSRADPTRADEYFEKSLTLCRAHGPLRRIEAQTRFWLGNLRLKQNQVDDALALFNQVFDVCRELGDQTGVGQALRGLSQCHLARNNVEEARATLLQALEIAEQPRATLLVTAIRRDLEALGR